MADSGKNASFSFAGTVYDADDCLQAWDLADAVQDVVYQCDGKDKHAAGTRQISFGVTLALSADDTTKVIALRPGTTGAWEGHPGGDTAGNIEVTATKGTIITAPLSAPVNGIITTDVSIALDDVTYTTST